MCAKNTWFANTFGGNSNATVNTSTPTSKAPTSFSTFGSFGDAGPANQKDTEALDPSLAPPDATDKAIRSARVAQLMRLRMARGRAASFLTDPTAT